MQNIKSLVKFLLILFPFYLQAQTSYIPIGSKDYWLLNRLEIKSRLVGFNASYINPASRKLMVHEIEQLDSLQRNGNKISTTLTSIDKYNMLRFLMAGKEYTNPTSSFNNKKTSFNFIEINKPKFFLVLNPALQAQATAESSSYESSHLYSAGISGRSLLGKKIALNVYATVHEERTPSYIADFTQKYKAIPGFNNYTIIKNGDAIQYVDVRASMQWTLAKFIDMQAGYDRNFLGNGHRSLLLSDFSGNALFAKINTKLWKLRFENLYMKLTPQFDAGNGTNVAKKYLRINTLSVDVTNWLNVGVFDAVVFGRKNQFEINYLLPFTFLRAMEQQSGSPDNALVGLNLKANINKQVQVYSQLLLDEFLLKEIKAKNDWWGNKYGYQLGAKYIDAFNVKNLDLQVEVNRVRTFTYTHYDTIANYSNNSMPLAHPLGAGFQEYIILAKYQPLKKLFLQGKLIAYTQGQDTSNVNHGNNILLNYRTRPFEYGWAIGSGNKANCIYLNIIGSYEIKENFFVDAGITFRNYTLQKGAGTSLTMLSLGFRWNMNRREFDF